MNLELAIARRIFNNPHDKRSASHTIIRISLGGIALGLAMMIFSVAVVTGFKNEISLKVVGFGSHIQITQQDMNTSYQAQPIERNLASFSELRKLKGVQHIQAYGIKAGIVKTATDIHGVVLKGVDEDYQWNFIAKHLQEGRLPRFSDTVRSREVLVSRYIAKLMKLKVGDKMTTHFIQQQTSIRNFEIVGIYDTGLEIYDKILVICDLQQIQSLNHWNNNHVTGYEILLENFDNLDEQAEKIWALVGNQYDKNTAPLTINTIRDLKPEIFTWLDLTDMNVIVILTLMLLVASVNMTSSLLILILERTRMIGILKSLGMPNVSLSKIFLYNAALLTSKGLLWGNVLGLSIALVQLQFHVIPLDPSSYYLNTVPINLEMWHLLALNVGSLITIVLVLVVPSRFISLIDPIKAIRFD